MTTLEGGFWVIKHAVRETNRRTQRKKIYLMHVYGAYAECPLDQERAELSRLINLVTRTRPRRDERPDTGQFASGSEGNRLIKNGDTIVQCYGSYVLRMSGATPETSDWLMWNDHPIDQATWRGLWMFELDPDTLKPLEPDTMHKPRLKELALFDIGAHDLDDEADE